MVRVYTDVLGEKVSFRGGHRIGNSKQKSVYVHVPYTERCLKNG
jgi:hypothetical protein